MLFGAAVSDETMSPSLHEDPSHNIKTRPIIFIQSVFNAIRMSGLLWPDLLLAQMFNRSRHFPKLVPPLANGDSLCVGREFDSHLGLHGSPLVFGVA